MRIDTEFLFTQCTQRRPISIRNNICVVECFTLTLTYRLIGVYLCSNWQEIQLIGREKSRQPSTCVLIDEYSWTVNVTIMSEMSLAETQTKRFSLWHQWCGINFGVAWWEAKTMCFLEIDRSLPTDSTIHCWLSLSGDVRRDTREERRIFL